MENKLIFMSFLIETINDLMLKIKPLMRYRVTIFAGKNYKFQVFHLLLLLILLFAIGFTIGLYFSKLEIAKQIFSAPVFSGIFTSLILILGFNFIKNKEQKRKMIEKRLELLSEVFLLKEVFSSNLINYCKLIIQNFEGKVIILLHNLLLLKLLEKPYNHLFKELEAEMLMTLNANHSYSSRFLKIYKTPVVPKIYWFFELILNGTEFKGQLTNYSVQIASIFVCETETVVGIFARVNDVTSANQIYKIKGRTLEKPLAVYTHNPFFYAHNSKLASAFIEAFKEKPLTVVLKAKFFSPRLAKKNGFIGIRLLSKNSHLSKFIENLGDDLLGTSANISNKEPVKELNMVEKSILSHAQVLEFKEFSSGIPSSVIKIEENLLIILRKGLFIKEIEEWAILQNGKLIMMKIEGEETPAYVINQ